MPGWNTPVGSRRQNSLVADPPFSGCAIRPERGHYTSHPRKSQRSTPGYYGFPENHWNPRECPECYIEQSYFDNEYTARDRDRTRRQKRYPCWGCGHESFDTIPRMLRHLEGGTCIADWTIKHINALAVECEGSQSYVIQNQRPWLLAGAPRQTVMEYCYDERLEEYRCPECGKGFGSKSVFANHLQRCSGYPFVLRCPQCPIDRNKFFRISELLEHVGSQRCSEDEDDKIWKDLRDGLRKNLAHRKTQGRLNRFGYELLPTKKVRGKLEVHVSEDDGKERLR